MANTTSTSSFAGSEFGLPDLSMNNTLGAALIGTVVSAMIFGITNLQVFLYFHLYKDDYFLHKLSVVFLWLLDATQMGLTVHFIYHYAITEWGVITGLAPIIWSFKLQFVCTIAILLLVQTFYTIRLWRISDGRYILPLIVTAVVLGGYAVGILLALKIYSIDSLLEIPSIKLYSYLGFGTNTGVDLVIAVCFWLYFRTHDVHLRTSSTSSIVSRIAMYMVSTGLMTGILSVIALLLFMLFPQSLIFISVELLVAKLYVNSFMAMLNARKQLRNISTDRWARGEGLSLSNPKNGLRRNPSSTKSNLSPTSPAPILGLAMPWPQAHYAGGQRGREPKNSTDTGHYYGQSG